MYVYQCVCAYACLWVFVYMGSCVSMFVYVFNSNYLSARVCVWYQNKPSSTSGKAVLRSRRKVYRDYLPLFLIGPMKYVTTHEQTAFRSVGLTDCSWQHIIIKNVIYVLQSMFKLHPSERVGLKAHLPSIISENKRLTY